MLKLYIYLVLSTLIFADDIYIASVAGYKRPVEKIVENYEKESGNKVNCVFGNKQQVITYLNNSEKISLVVGDITLINKINTQLKNKKILGKGRLVLAFRKELKIKSIFDLENKKIKRIGIPDPKKAIYGNAAIQSIATNKLNEKLEKKFILLSTVPQVSSYLKRGEIDAGFINYTDYIGIQGDDLEKIDIDTDSYKEINIFAGKVSERSTEFYDYLSNTISKEILKEYGL